jgi:hypothetical protein
MVQGVAVDEVVLDTVKEEILAKTTPPGGKPGRYRPGDELLAFLNNL